MPDTKIFYYIKPAFIKFACYDNLHIRKMGKNQQRQRRAEILLLRWGRRQGFTTSSQTFTWSSVFRGRAPHAQPPSDSLPWQDPNYTDM